MRYSSYIRPVEGASTAVLFIHGIVGTPAHFKDLLPLVPDSWSVYNILLDGHGKQVEDFARTSMGKWKQQVADQLEQILETHDKVLIVAHSMGTLFAIAEAIKHPQHVKGLLLLAVPLTPRVRFSAAVNSVIVALGRARPGTPAMDIYQDSGVHLSPKLWKYITWLPRFWELITESRATRKKLPLLTVPCRCFQSRKDELVSRRAYRLLAGQHHIVTTELQNSGHFCYGPEDLTLLQSVLKEMIDAIA